MARYAWGVGWESLSQRMLAQTVEQEGISIQFPDGGLQ